MRALTAVVVCCESGTAAGAGYRDSQTASEMAILCVRCVRELSDGARQRASQVSEELLEQNRERVRSLTDGGTSNLFLAAFNGGIRALARRIMDEITALEGQAMCALACAPDQASVGDSLRDALRKIFGQYEGRLAKLRLVQVTVERVHAGCAEWIGGFQTAEQNLVRAGAPEDEAANGRLNTGVLRICQVIVE